MIFVTVGTHEQQFNRLIKCIDFLKEKGVFKDEVVIQTGFSTYEPRFCKWSKLFPYKEMKRYVDEARIIITHGGPASFIMALQVGKTPIVVPRQKKYEEHVNDHQLEFALAVQERYGNICVIDEIDKLEKSILDYDFLVSKQSKEMKSNNLCFNKELEEIVLQLFAE